MAVGCLSTAEALPKHGQLRPATCKVKNRFVRVDADPVVPGEAEAATDGQYILI
jgi:hypothetical protein